MKATKSTAKNAKAGAVKKTAGKSKTASKSVSKPKAAAKTSKSKGK